MVVGSRAGRCALVVLLIVVLAGCQNEWSSAYFDRGLSSFNANESAVTSSTVGSITKRFHVDIGSGEPTNMVVINGVLLIGTTDGRLVAADAKGSVGCSGTPVVCTPRWTAQTFASTVSVRVTSFVVPYSSPAAYRVVATPVGSPAGAHVMVYDAAGTQGCSGTPKVCTPLWQTDRTPQSEPNVGGSSLFVIDGQLSAYDLAGSTNCSGTPRICSAVWSATGVNIGVPAITDTTVFVASFDGDHTLAFDVAGVANCSGTPKVCTPTWQTSADGALSTSALVAGGKLYATELQYGLGGASTQNQYVLRVFDAAGSTNCSGVPKVCTPTLVTPLPQGGAAFAVADGTLYGISHPVDYNGSNGNSYALEPGCTSSCPSWSVAGLGIVPDARPIVAADLAYFMRTYRDPSGNPTFALEARTLNDGSLRWAALGWYDPIADDGFYPSGAIVSGGRVYVTVRSAYSTQPRVERGVDVYA